MKTLIKKSLVIFFALGLLIISCKKDHAVPGEDNSLVKPRYSTVEEFRQGIAQVVSLIQQHRIIAYLDSLKNGYPDINGRKVPLAQFGYSILAKLQNNQVESAVYDVFHFDEATFSLISYLMKAQMVNDISGQTFTSIMATIPLPPIPVEGFDPPTVEVKDPAIVTGGDCCDDCVPEIKIRVTWVYKPACGNYEKKTSGYAAGNTLTGMSGGRTYRFDAEVTGCDCPGTWSSTVTAPAGASYGVSAPAGGPVTLFPQSGGTYTITFTYKVCDKVFTKTFTLSID